MPGARSFCSTHLVVVGVRSRKVKLPMISARLLEPPVEPLKCSEFAEAIIKQFK